MGVSIFDILKKKGWFAPGGPSPNRCKRLRRYPGREGSRVRSSGKKQLPGPDCRLPDAYMQEEVEDYGACPRGSLNPES
jgi:hypothetical protein